MVAGFATTTPEPRSARSTSWWTGSFSIGKHRICPAGFKCFEICLMGKSGSYTSRSNEEYSGGERLRPFRLQLLSRTAWLRRIAISHGGQGEQTGGRVT